MTRHEYFEELRAHERFVKEYEAEKAAEAQRKRDAAEAIALEKRVRPVLQNIEQVAGVNLNDGSHQSAELRLLHQVIAQHLSEPPAIRVEWLRWGTLSGDIVGLDNAIAHPSRRTIVLWPIAQLQEAITALHEIGHVRDPNVGVSRKLQGEVSAWRWAMQASPIWNNRCHAWLREALKTYLAVYASKGSVLDVIEVERLMSDETLRAHYKSSKAAVRDFENAEFWRRWGRRPCEVRRYCAADRDAVAIGKIAYDFACRTCLEAHRTDMALRDLRGLARRSQ